jgi:hypothetical protein
MNEDELLTLDSVAAAEQGYYNEPPLPEPEPYNEPPLPSLEDLQAVDEQIAAATGAPAQGDLAEMYGVAPSAEVTPPPPPQQVVRYDGPTSIAGSGPQGPYPFGPPPGRRESMGQYRPNEDESQQRYLDMQGKADELSALLGWRVPVEVLDRLHPVYKELSETTNEAIEEHADATRYRKQAEAQGQFEQAHQTIWQHRAMLKDQERLEAEESAYLEKQSVMNERREEAHRFMNSMSEELYAAKDNYDPGRRFKEMGPGAKAGLIFAAALAGFGGGWNGDPDAGVRLIEGLLDREADKQMEEYNRLRLSVDDAERKAQMADNLVARLDSQFGETRMRKLALRNVMIETLLKEAESIKAIGDHRSLGPAWDQIEAEYKMQHARNKAEVAELYARHPTPTRTVMVNAVQGADRAMLERQAGRAQTEADMYREEASHERKFEGTTGEKAREMKFLERRAKAGEVLGDVKALQAVYDEIAAMPSLSGYYPGIGSAIERAEGTFLEGPLRWVSSDGTIDTRALIKEYENAMVPLKNKGVATDEDVKRVVGEIKQARSEAQVRTALKRAHETAMRKAAGKMRGFGDDVLRDIQRTDDLGKFGVWLQPGQNLVGYGQPGGGVVDLDSDPTE